MTPRGRCECCLWERVTFLEIAWEGGLGSQEELMGGPASQAGCYGSPAPLLAEASSHSSSRGTRPSHPWPPLRAVALGAGHGGSWWSRWWTVGWAGDWMWRSRSCLGPLALRPQGQQEGPARQNWSVSPHGLWPCILVPDWMCDLVQHLVVKTALEV